MAASSYGVDIAALTDLPDPEQLVAEEDNVAYAMARRLLTPTGAYNEDTGDPEPYDSLDLRDWLGARTPTASDLHGLESQIQQVLSQEPRAALVSVQVLFSQGLLTVNVSADGADGPFQFVLTIDQMTGGVSLQVE